MLWEPIERDGFPGLTPWAMVISMTWPHHHSGPHGPTMALKPSLCAVGVGGRPSPWDHPISSLSPIG